MSGLRHDEGNSGGLLEFWLASLLPVEWRQLGDFLVGRRGQSLQHVFEIRIRFDAVQPAVLDQGVHHRTARSVLECSSPLELFFQLVHYPSRARYMHAYCTDAGENQASYPYKMTAQDMTQRYRKFKRSWGMWYAFDNATGNLVSLKTRVKSEVEQKVNAMNETERQPGISLGLAKDYLNAADPKLATRTWQEVMEHIVAKKKGEMRRRWETAIKDVNLDCIRYLTTQSRQGQLRRVRA